MRLTILVVGMVISCLFGFEAMIGALGPYAMTAAERAVARVGMLAALLGFVASVLVLVPVRSPPDADGLIRFSRPVERPDADGLIRFSRPADRMLVLLAALGFGLASASSFLVGLDYGPMAIFWGCCYLVLAIITFTIAMLRPIAS
jgi:hypothetical protein